MWWPNQHLTKGQALTSPNGQYQLVLQEDGNLVLYKDNSALWSSHTDNQPVSHATLLEDGNLVIYGYHGPLWESNTSGHHGSFLVVQDDGNIVMYKAPQDPAYAVWATNTTQS
jgi:hypothetical protein